VDVSFLAVVAVALCFMSAMIVLRLAASGAPASRIAVSIAELWLSLAIWVAVFRALGRTIGPPAGSGEAAELRTLTSRLAEVSGATRVWLFLGLAASVALAGHLMWSLGRSKCFLIRS